VVQRALIDRVVQLQLHLDVMDRRFAAEHTMSDHASRQYLAWSASLARLMRQLNVQATPAAAPQTLAERLAAARAADASAASTSRTASAPTPPSEALEAA